MLLTGGCHCGAVTVRLHSARAPHELQLRACQCGFCRMHRVRTVSDPQGRLTIECTDENLLGRYRFGLSVSDFLVCKRCGVYLGAILESPALSVATLNINVLENAPFESPAVAPVNYDHETAGARTTRRLKQWTPTTLYLARR